MPEYNSNLRALNDILGDYGLPGGRRFEIDALNALAVHLGGAGGHQFNIGALNEIVGLVEGSGTFQFEIDAYNEISRALGGRSDFQFVEDALSEISDLPPFEQGGGGEEPEWLPEGAVVFSDFGAGNHYAGGEITTLNDVWEENAGWSVWDSGLVTEDGITNHETDAAPTMNRTYSTPILAGNYYFRLTGFVDEQAQYELAATSLPGLTRHRQVNVFHHSSGPATFNISDFAGVNEDFSSLDARPNIAAVMAITANTVRASVNGSPVELETVDTGGDALTDLAIGILGSDGSTIFTAAFYTGVPSDEVMRTLSLVGTPASPVNADPPHITDNGTDAFVDTPGMWTGNPAPSQDAFTYQWYRDGVAIEDAVTAGYTYVPEDVGADVKVRETATNYSGSASADSNIVVPA